MQLPRDSSTLLMNSRLCSGFIEGHQLEILLFLEFAQKAEHISQSQQIHATHHERIELKGSAPVRGQREARSRINNDADERNYDTAFHANAGAGGDDRK